MKKLSFLTLILIISCTSEPKPIEYGSDMCHFCKMTVVDEQHAAEAVTSKGKVYFFDAIECMVNYIDDHKETQFDFLLVNDYENPGKLLNAADSHFLISKAIPSPMGAYLSAFSSMESATKKQMEKGGTLFDWEGIQEELIGTPISER